MLDHSRELDGLVLSGSGALDELARAARSSPPGANILNTSFEPARTPCDWLSRDPKVDAFLNDALCFAQLQPQSFASFLAAAPRLSEGESLRKIRSDLPIYVFSGSEDPVGLRLQGAGILIERYRKAGINSIDHHFYPGGRHEMLNEINREEVVTNLVAWISATLRNRPLA